MTPATPSSSDGSSTPPRQRPNKGKLSEDTAESDLWAFDDGNDTSEKRETPTIPVTPAQRRRDVPQPRAGSDIPHQVPEPGSERIQVNVSKSKTRKPSAAPSIDPVKMGSDFDDLENWEDSITAPAPEIENPKPASRLGDATLPEPLPERAAPPSDPVAASREPELAPEDRPVTSAPSSLKPNWKLSKMERVGLIALSALLVIGAVTVIAFSLSRLPTEPAAVKANDFPINGKFVTVSSAVTYWRPPILEGKNPDTFRRGTVLLPVIDLVVPEGSGALRVVFRNPDGESVGDVVTRSVQRGQSLQIAATAGFDDLGMHSAYRTGESKPWTIEVDEAPSVNSNSSAFVSLFKMNISTDRRSTL